VNFLALLLFQTDVPVEAAEAAAPAYGSVLDLLLQSGPVAKLVLLVLLAASVFSWAIIYVKWQRFRALREQGEKFLSAFRKARTMADFNVLLDNFPAHPLKSVFEAGFHEAMAQSKDGAGPIKNPVSVTRALQIASAQQLSELEQNLNWLATAGAVTPFIGLFGTVWGIMGAFIGLGAAGAASIRAVGPGIAEALIATAAGLFVAIPAVIAYNQFLGRVREMGVRLDNFSLEFLNAVDRSGS
jgi:biopolymer transport protein TolQ